MSASIAAGAEAVAASEGCWEMWRADCSEEAAVVVEVTEEVAKAGVEVDIEAEADMDEGQEISAKVNSIALLTGNRR
jgi:hypothetical protein